MLLSAGMVPDQVLIRVEDEFMKVTAVNGARNSLSVTRAVAPVPPVCESQSTAVVHDAGKMVKLYDMLWDAIPGMVTGDLEFQQWSHDTGSLLVRKP